MQRAGSFAFCWTSPLKDPVKPHYKDFFGAMRGDAPHEDAGSRDVAWVVFWFFVLGFPHHPPPWELAPCGRPRPEGAAQSIVSKWRAKHADIYNSKHSSGDPPNKGVRMTEIVRFDTPARALSNSRLCHCFLLLFCAGWPVLFVQGHNCSSTSTALQRQPHPDRNGVEVLDHPLPTAPKANSESSSGVDYTSRVFVCISIYT